MNRKIASLALALPATFIAGAIAVPRQDKKLDVSSAIAVVDIDRVSKSYAKVKSLQDTLKEDAKQLKAKGELWNKQIAQLKGEAEILDAYTPQRTEATAKYEAEVARAKSCAEAENQRFTYRHLEIVEMVYADVQKAVTALAEQQGLQLVLRARRAPEPADAPLDERVLRGWEPRDVLYFAPKVDMTDQVIAYLKTAEFATSGASNGK